MLALNLKGLFYFLGNKTEFYIGSGVIALNMP